MRVVFMGTPQFAVPALERLDDSRHEVALVVTQPDRRAGRGRKPTLTEIKEVAQKRNLPIEQPERIKGTDFHRTLEALEADVGIVAAYGLILPAEMLRSTRLGFINIHASLLPKWRGAAPIQRSIMAGERKTGVTIMAMDEGMDTGDILARATVDILPDDDAFSVSNMIAVTGADLLLRVLDEVEAKGAIIGEPQNHHEATYAPKIKKSDGWIDWRRDMDGIIAQTHALRPKPGAFSKIGDALLRVLEAEPDESYDDGKLKPEDRPEPGEVVALIKKLGPIVRVGDGYLALTKVQPESKAPMSGAAWVNGKGVRVGSRFENPPESEE